MNAKSSYIPERPSNRTTYILGGLAVAVIAVIVIVGVIWSSSRNETRNEGYGSVRNSEVTAQLLADGTVSVGKPNAARTIDLFEDPLCPFCGQLEQLYGQELAQAIDEGKIAVRYHLLDFLNAASASGDYSTRAVAATQCVAETGDGPAYSKFHAELFAPANQPKEKGSTDHTNAELAQIATDAGANDTAVQCISTGAKVQSAAASAATAKQAMAALGGSGTPAVFDGKSAVDIRDSSWVANLAK